MLEHAGLATSTVPVKVASRPVVPLYPKSPATMLAQGGPFASSGAGVAAGTTTKTATAANTKANRIFFTLVSSRSLLELEPGVVLCPVDQRQAEDVAASLRGRCPVVDELVVLRVVPQDRAARRQRRERTVRVREAAQRQRSVDLVGDALHSVEISDEV